MAVIQPKRKSVIQKGTSYSYNPSTFKNEHLVKNFYEVEDPVVILRALENCGRYALDTETYTTGLPIRQQPIEIVRRWVGTGKTAVPQDFPFCFSFCDGVNAYSIYDTIDNRFNKFKQFREMLEDKTTEKILHNVKFDRHVVNNIGLDIKGTVHDTVVIAKLANENRNSFKLVDLMKDHPKGIVKFEYMVDAYKKLHKIADYRMIPRELMNMYANADVWNAYWLFDDEYKIIIKDELEKLYKNEADMTVVLYEMERIGMLTDTAYLLEQEVEMTEEVAVEEQKIYDQAGTVFNINSVKQLYKVLLDLGTDARLIPITPKGNPSLDKKVLEKLSAVHKVPIVQQILHFRKVERLLGTYIKGLLMQQDAEDRVHGSINQTEATTGRMSITKPALQTLPKKDKRIRRAFIPAEDYELYFMDLDQVEYRLFAHYAKAIGLIDAIKNGLDVHTATAAILFSKNYDDITEEERNVAKTLNFALLYGMGLGALAISLGVIESEARAFRERYFAQIPEAEPFIASVHRVTRTRGYVKNHYDRRRRLNYDECYKAPNALVQGVAADYIKHKILLVYKFLKSHNYKTRMLLPVHDEISFEVHNTEKHLVPKLIWLLSDFTTFRCPITAGVEKGCPSWGQKEKVEVGFEPLTEQEMALTVNYCIVKEAQL